MHEYNTEQTARTEVLACQRPGGRIEFSNGDGRASEQGPGMAGEVDSAKGFSPSGTIP